MLIQPTKRYPLREIAEKEMIPGVTGFMALYALVSKKEKGSKSRELFEETTRTTIKAVHDGKPWKKNKGKLFIEGKELLKFLKIHNL